MKKAVSILFVRGLGVGMAAVGAIWVARALGPEKLGISTFVLSLISLAGVLTSLNQDYNFVRRGKQVSSTWELDDIVEKVTSLRLGISLIVIGAGLVVLAIVKVDSSWYLAVAAGFVLVFVQSNGAGWILQLRNRMPKYFIAVSIQSFLTGLLCVLLIRPDWPAGSDLVMACAGSATGMAAAWWWAGGERPQKLNANPEGFIGGLKLLNGGRWLLFMGLGTYALTSAEQLLIGILASVEQLGVYRAALQFINIINPFLPLFFYKLYPHLIELQQTSPSAVIPAQFGALGRVALFGFPLIAGAFLLAPWVYPLVFGAAFAGAATPFAVLFAGKVVSVGANIFMWGAFARHRDREVVLITLGVACLSLAMNVVLIPRIGLIGAALVSCAAQCILLGGYIMVMFQSSARAGGLHST